MLCIQRRLEVEKKNLVYEYFDFSLNADVGKCREKSKFGGI